MVDHTQSQNKWKQYCVGESNDPNLKTLSLVSCQWGREHAGAATGKFSFDGGKLRETDSDTCLTYASDLTMDGAPLALGACDEAPSFSMAHGSIMTDGRCVTAGWPFFQGAAFERPDGAVAVVVVNEAGSAAQFELEVDGDLVLRSIGPHSINTFVVREVDGGGGGGWGGAHGGGGYSGFGGGGSGGWGEYGGSGGGGERL